MLLYVNVDFKQTDRRTENTIHRAAWSQLKTSHFIGVYSYQIKLVYRYIFCLNNCLMRSGDKPLPESILSQNYIIWRYFVILK